MLRIITQELLTFAVPVDDRARFEYGQTVESILRKYPKTPNARTEAHLVSVGVDMNDVWIASVALQHNMTLLSADGMAKICECRPDMRIENWLV